MKFFSDELPPLIEMAAVFDKEGPDGESRVVIYPNVSHVLEMEKAGWIIGTGTQVRGNICYHCFYLP